MHFIDKFYVIARLLEFPVVGFPSLGCTYLVLQVSPIKAFDLMLLFSLLLSETFGLELLAALDLNPFVFLHS